MYSKLLSSVMNLGEQMLISGAEIYRVEDCLNRIFKAYDFKHIDTFIITSCMIVSITDNDGNVTTQTRRINSIGTNIEKLHRLNNLSRLICNTKMSIEQLDAHLEKIINTKTFPLPIKIIANALIAGSFTLFFGGNIIETIVSFFIGSVMQLTYFAMSKLNTNRLLEKMFCSLFMSALAFLSVKFAIADSVDKIIIGNIMSMIPGIGFTNALRDLFKGDIFTGVHATIESLLISAALAAGYLVTALFLGGGLI